ncbi:hypothetical protein G7043_41295 [Lentzea sp. NEAU-D13]|uniref:Uncharacterized protein n=1 Tax=Lentzea alba TaxID=2714351 RepID=A0A7C9RXI1_9PSEU|nr:hypothetical protein [Lentzea alba]NGY65349.1 hypothetical protein [Lentzea alba]
MTVLPHAALDSTAPTRLQGAVAGVDGKLSGRCHPIGCLGTGTDARPENLPVVLRRLHHGFIGFDRSEPSGEVMEIFCPISRLFSLGIWMLMLGFVVGVVLGVQVGG